VAELNKEQFESLPEFVKGDYEQAGDVYRPVAEGKLSALKGSLNDLDAKYKQANTRIEEIEKGKAAEIERAKEEALKTARNKGDVDAIEKRYQEQMADLEKRNGETLKQYEDRIAKLSGSIKTKERSLLVGNIAQELKVFDESKKLFSKLIEGRIDVDPETGKVTYLDENGGATSLDAAGFVAELAKDSAYDRLRQAAVSNGGQANGNNGSGGGASGKVNQAAEDAKKNGDVSGFLTATIKASQNGK
jgi:tetratricopeptide (TPR) repeat protein